MSCFIAQLILSGYSEAPPVILASLQSITFDVLVDISTCSRGNKARSILNSVIASWHGLPASISELKSRFASKDRISPLIAWAIVTECDYPISTYFITVQYLVFPLVKDGRPKLVLR